jgi:hypothetical protein
VIEISGAADDSRIETDVAVDSTKLVPAPPPPPVPESL